MVVFRNFENGQLANTLWSMLRSHHMSGFPLRDLFDRADEPIPLQLLKLHVGLLILTTKLDLSTLYVYKLRLVKASEGFEHETVIETVIVTVQCPGSESQ